MVTRAVWTILLPLLSSLVCLAFGRINKTVRDYFALLVTLVTCVFAFMLIPEVVKAPIYVQLWNVFGMEGINLSINVDGLSLFMLCLISFLGCLATLYSIPYMKDHKNTNLYYFLLLIFIGSMNAAVIAGDFITFFLSWELMTISSFALVLFDGTEEARKAGIKYFIMTAVCALFMLLGIALVYRAAGTLSLPLLMQSGLFADTALIKSALILFLIGLGVKAGMVPLHTWLPDAHPAAPSPISSLLSGVMIKVGIYMMIRIFFQIFHVTIAWNLLLCALGSITILVGVFFALIQHDAKRLLAFHSISQIGYIILGIGVGTSLGVAGALFHLLNHACFKGLLFLCIGAVIYRTGERNLEKLGGLAKSMPITFITCVVASLSISGIPPFNGFTSKWLIYQSLIAKNDPVYFIFLIAAVFGSALTLASFVKLLYSTFLGQKPKELVEPKEVNWQMKVPMIILALLCILLGVFAGVPLNLVIGPIVGSGEVLKGIWDPSLATLLMLVGAIIGLVIYLIGNIRSARISPTYVGGETLNEETMRVEGPRFYDTIKKMKLFAFLYKQEEKEKLDIYPHAMQDAEMSTGFVFKYIERAIDALYVICGKIGRFFIDILKKFHSGSISRYILWVLIGFIILLSIVIK